MVEEARMRRFFMRPIHPYSAALLAATYVALPWRRWVDEGTAGALGLAAMGLAALGTLAQYAVPLGVVVAILATTGVALVLDASRRLGSRGAVGTAVGGPAIPPVASTTVFGSSASRMREASLLRTASLVSSYPDRRPFHDVSKPAMVALRARVSVSTVVSRTRLKRA